MGKQRQVITKKDVGTVPEDLLKVPDRPSSAKITKSVLDELTKRAEKEFQEHLGKAIRNLRGAVVSPDDTIRVGINFEVCVEPREITE
jgi:hypothetical protein